jgi:hypothetical protein
LARATITIFLRERKQEREILIGSSDRDILCASQRTTDAMKKKDHPAAPQHHAKWNVG